ncbi:MAG TPA: outer membrane protein assembly factor BamA [Stellaceae bacterium]|nr:outer membrane protein assembly factor BamA [Stellaceae bacterium]
MLARAAVRVALAVALIVMVLPFAQVKAQIPAGGTVQEIRIEGTQRVEPETVRSYLLVQPGDAFDSDRIDKSLKALFATGLFSDVTLRREGDALIVRVVENPVVNRIAFEGNHRLSDQSLTDEIQMRPRVVYTREKVQSDVKRILDLYRRNSRFAATVDPKVIPLEQNRVDLVFEINEGPVTGIESINFIGNRAYSASKLREVIQTKESRWYRLLSSDDSYDPDRMTYDRDLLRKFYLSNGYADFRLVSAVAELAPARDGFLLTFTVDEGDRYKFGKITITNELPVISATDLTPLLRTKLGDWYNADAVEASINALTDALGNLGYAFVDIQPQIRRNAEDRTVDVLFTIKEGPRVYVERIDISGNLRTLDSVIRREFRLVEGDAFNSSKLHRSEQAIKNLNFFEKVNITNVPGSAADKTIINAEVQEKSTGEFSVGVGYSTSDGPLADIGIHERNLLGRGQDLRLDTVVALRNDQVDLSFTEPYFLGRRIAAGFDIFADNRDNTQIAGFSQFTVGGTLRAGYQITEPLRQTLTYTLRQDRIYNIQSTASTFIAAEAGTRVTSDVGQVILYDMRDNLQDPTSGYFYSINSDVAGLGGNVAYLRLGWGGGIYYPVSAPDYILSLIGSEGHIHGLGQDVRLEDRFYVGGDNLRGFQTGGIGPRDALTHDSLGGETYYTGSLTMTFPSGLPQELGVGGRVFTDFGSLFSIHPTGIGVLDSRSMRVSIGTGLSWKSPLGPIKVDLGFPVLRKSYDRSELFHVSFGSRF